MWWLRNTDLGSKRLHSTAVVDTPPLYHMGDLSTIFLYSKTLSKLKTSDCSQLLFAFFLSIVETFATGLLIITSRHPIHSLHGQSFLLHWYSYVAGVCSIHKCIIIIMMKENVVHHNFHTYFGQILLVFAFQLITNYV